MDELGLYSLLDDILSGVRSFTSGKEEFPTDVREATDGNLHVTFNDGTTYCITVKKVDFKHGD